MRYALTFLIVFVCDTSEIFATDKLYNSNAETIISFDNIVFIVCGISLLCSVLALCISMKRHKCSYNDDYESFSKSPFCNQYVNNINYKENERKIIELNERVAQLEQSYASLQNIQKLGLYSSNVNQCNIDNTISQQKNNKDIKTNMNSSLNISSQQHFIWLRVADGAKLVAAQSPDAAYYKAWKKNGKLYFEFSCYKTEKAINNRTSLIEPFCDIIENKIQPDSAKNIIVNSCGILANDYSVIKKVIIQYS